MSLGIYDLSVPAFQRSLKSLTTILTKGAAHVEAKKLEPAALLTARLYPDMFHLTRQVQMSTSMIKWGCALLAGLERPDDPSTETTFDELKTRVAKTGEYVAGFSPSQLNGSEDKPVKLVFPRVTLEFTGKSFLLEFILPNLYFHTAMAYGILRHNGVEVGKGDFLARG
ncbi:MAG: DUF1993 domain-containing protein [Rhodospirillaceae bacterium]|nr:DUF1993 domain-containing protein [Rhodospirillaceae bacterium]